MQQVSGFAYFCNNSSANYVSVSLVANDGTKFGFKNPNNSFTGALRSLQARKCDIAFIGYFIKDYETRDVEFSSPLYSDQVCVIVKKANRIPQFILPLIMFDRTLWMFLGLETVVGNLKLSEYYSMFGGEKGAKKLNMMMKLK
jgi:ABC-type amino acid transport substrate-binding protein